MLKLINIGLYNGTSKLSGIEVIKRFVNAINNNSEIFTATIDSGYNYIFSITSSNISIKNIGTSATGTNNTMKDCGYCMAIDDDKEFLIIVPRIILNTQSGDPNYSSNGFLTSSDSGYPIETMLCATGKDVNGNNFEIHGERNTAYYQGISCWLDIGQHETDEYATEGDYILRQGAIRNHIVPELFFSMTRLGACGDIIEKDGHQYTCIAGPIFYQIS